MNGFYPLSGSLPVADFYLAAAEQMNDYGLNGKLFEWDLCPCLWGVLCTLLSQAACRRLCFKPREQSGTPSDSITPTLAEKPLFYLIMVLYTNSHLHLNDLTAHLCLGRPGRESVFCAKDLPTSNRLRLTKYRPTLSLSEQLMSLRGLSNLNPTVQI